MNVVFRNCASQIVVTHRQLSKIREIWKRVGKLSMDVIARQYQLYEAARHVLQNLVDILFNYVVTEVDFPKMIKCWIKLPEAD